MSHTVTNAHPNTILFVGVGVAAGGPTPTVDFNGTSLTSIVNHSNVGTVYLFGLINPDTGTHNITVTLSSGANTEAYGVSFYNADQNTGWGATQTGNGAGSPASISVTTTANNSFVIDSVLTTFTAITAGGSQTEIQNVNQNDWIYGGSRTTSVVATSGTSQAMSWTGVGAWTQVAVEVLNGPSSQVLKVSSVAQASIAKVSGVTNANAKKIAGVANA